MKEVNRERKYNSSPRVRFLGGALAAMAAGLKALVAALILVIPPAL